MGAVGGPGQGFHVIQLLTGWLCLLSERQRTSWKMTALALPGLRRRYTPLAHLLVHILPTSPPPGPTPLLSSPPPSPRQVLIYKPRVEMAQPP